MAAVHMVAYFLPAVRTAGLSKACHGHTALTR